MEIDRDSAGIQDSGNFVKPQYQAKSRGKRSQLAIYEHLPMGIVENSLDGDFVSVNEEFCRLLGYKRHEVLPLNIRDVTYQDDYSTEGPLLDQLITGIIPFINRKNASSAKTDMSFGWSLPVL